MRIALRHAPWLLLLLAGMTAQSNQSAPARPTRTIALPGVHGRIDHITADPAGHRLYLSALGNDTLEVVDLAAGRRVSSIPGLQEPQGISYSPTTRRLFVANGRSGKLKVFDVRGLIEIRAISIGDDADNVRREPS